MKCKKCGREVSYEYCDFFSDALDGGKFCFHMASEVTGHLKKYWESLRTLIQDESFLFIVISIIFMYDDSMIGMV